MNFNAWGLLVIALGGAALWWATKQSGSLNSLLEDLALGIAGGAAAKAVIAPGGKGKNSESPPDDEVPPEDPIPLPDPLP